MKSFLGAVILGVLAIASPVFAGNDSQNGSVHHNTTVNNTNQGGQGGKGVGIGKAKSKSESNAAAIAVGGNQKQNAKTGDVAIGGDKTYAAPPAMGTASLVAAPETCMGSVSAALSGGNGIVGAGVGFGKTYESEACNRRMNSKHLLNLAAMTGDARFITAAAVLLGQDEAVARAYRAAGIAFAPEQASAAPVAAESGQPVTQVPTVTDRLNDVQAN